jgi:hypothetical protein
MSPYIAGQNSWPPANLVQNFYFIVRVLGVVRQAGLNSFIKKMELKLKSHQCTVRGFQILQIPNLNP